MLYPPELQGPEAPRYRDRVSIVIEVEATLDPMPRILLLLPTSSYKATEFLDAARALGVEVVVATDRRQALAAQAPGRTIHLDFEAADPSRRARPLHAERRFAAVLGVDDETTVAASGIAAALGLEHNPPEAVATARDKARFRTLQHRAELPAPGFEVIPRDADPAGLADRVPYPCVLKPLAMSASRGVLRADGPEDFARAFARLGRLLRDDGGPRSRWVLVEDYLPGDEIALEALVDEGRLQPLAWFDKPDPLVGPTFAETLYVTPARISESVRRAATVAVQGVVDALGLRTGPLHAEVRLPHGSEPVVLEAAPRTIGGRCGRGLRFGGGRSLAQIVIGHALGEPPPGELAEPAGILMLPVPSAGRLRGVEGLEEAARVRGITGVEITVTSGQPVEPLPEGDRYLGFVFAEAATPDEVERALREAGAGIRAVIDAAPAGSNAAGQPLAEL